MDFAKIKEFKNEVQQMDTGSLKDSVEIYEGIIKNIVSVSEVFDSSEEYHKYTTQLNIIKQELTIRN